jgi:hypothetical protein
MANLLLYSYNPGEFVQYISACGEVHIGRILNVGQHNLTVQRWLPDPNHRSDDIFFPLCFVESFENQVIPIPSMSSLVLMAKKTDINQFKVRYVHGMTKIICTQQPDVILHHHHQSQTFIIFEGISRISMELQRVLSNRRENQACFSSFNLQLSELTWRFIVDILQVEEHEAVKVNTFSSVSGRDLSTTRVKVRTPCKVLRLEDRVALLRLISFFGISSVVGLRKRPPRVCQLKRDDTSVSAHEEI